MDGEIIDILDEAIFEAKENCNLINVTKSYCKSNSSKNIESVSSSIEIISKKQNKIIELLEDFSTKLMKQILKVG